MSTEEMPDLAHRRWSPRLSELLDGDLDAAETAACDAHVRTCAACRDDLAALAAVRATLRALPPDPLPSGGFADLATRLGPVAVAGGAGIPTRRMRSRLPWLAAAAAVAVVALRLSGIGVLVPGAPPADAAPMPSPVRVATREARPSYESSVAELRELLGTRRGTLAPETITVLEQSLAVIDTAIAEAEAAVARDTADPYLSTYLARARARKLALLRQAALLVPS